MQRREGVWSGVLLVIALAVLGSTSAPLGDAARVRPQSFSSNLFEVGIDGRGEHPLLSDPEGVSVLDLSPNRKLALLVRKRGNVNELVTVDLPSRAEQVLMQTPYSISTAVWAPDGKAIAFDLADTSSCTPGSAACATFQVWLVGADGSNPSLLRARAHQPSWSPDSRRLVFVGKFDPYAETGILTIMSRDGRSRRELGGTGERGHPSWSPDGRWIAYTTTGSNEKTGLVRLISSDGRIVRKFGPGNDLAWSPGGRQLAFARLERRYNPKTGTAERTSVYVLDRQTRRARRLASGESVSAPAWGPRGNLVAYAASNPPPSTAQLDLVQARGPWHRRVTRAPAGFVITQIFWSRDGRRLFYVRQ